MYRLFRRNSKVHHSADDRFPIPLNRTNSSPQRIVDIDEPILGVDYELLYKTSPFTWLIRTEVKSTEHFGYPEGKYNFVTMMDGTIRITPSTSRNAFQHAALANYALGVRFAGEIQFEAGHITDENGREIDYWTNQSDDYPSDHRLYRQAGLSTALFCMPDPSETNGFGR